MIKKKFKFYTNVIVLIVFYTCIQFEEVNNTCKMQQVGEKLEKMSISPQADTYDKIRLYLCTWNLGGCGPPKDLTELLDLKSSQLPDIYGIGFQEMDPSERNDNGNMWACKLLDVLGELDYVLIKSIRMQAISLQVYVKKELLLSITSIESEYSKAGMGGWWGNKGGVSIRFDVGGVNLIIVNTHLAAHQEYMNERIEDYNVVLNTQKFRDPDVDHILDHDYVFWIGDLNSRLDNITRDETVKIIHDNQHEQLLKLDQLKKAQKEGLWFIDFQEGPITFKPTYKFDKDTDIYDTSSKQRIPAWCDRILYKVQTDLEGLKAKKRKYCSPAYMRGDHKPVVASFDVNLLHYKSHPSYRESDHKPMTANFDVKVFDLRPYPFVEFSPMKQLKYGEKGEFHYTVRCGIEPDTSPWDWIGLYKRKYGEKGEFHYTVRCGIEPDTSPWDWIGLYKITFRKFEEYETYKYGVNDAEKKGSKGVTLTISGDYLRVPPGKYILCYISKYKNWLRGMSNVFEIV